MAGNRTSVTNLIGQIGHYSAENSNQKAEDADFVSQRLTGKGTEKLQEGMLAYKLQYETKIERYKEKYSLSDVNGENDINHRQFFREQFIQWVAAKNASEGNRYKGEPELRETKPDKATITMENLLDKQGKALYRLALEEEMNSSEYMNAVFRTSTSHFEGEKWAQRPVIIVAGPSGCGKSYAAQAAVEKTKQFLPKVDGEQSGNDVVAVDGGVAREVSQIRKLAIQLANNKGYTGIADLHAQSKVLEPVKDRIREAAFATPTLGVVIPETFSSYTNPFDDKRKLLHRIINMEGTRAVFCRVDGETPSSFKNIVAFMGSRRAWKTSNFKEQPLDLNNSEITESKAYGAGGFKFGQLGSKTAEEEFKKNAKEDLCMLITNELLLKKEASPGSNQWLDASQDDKGAILVSRRIFDGWQQLSSDEKPTLQEYMKAVRLPSLIQTSAELDLAIARESIRKSIVRTEAKFNAAKAKHGEQSGKVELLEGKLQHLEIISKNISSMDLHNKNEVDLVKRQVAGQLQEMKTNGDFGYLKLSRSKSALSKTVSALAKLSDELKLAEEKKAGDSQNIEDKNSKKQDFSSRFKAKLHRIKEDYPKPGNDLSPKMGG